MKKTIEQRPLVLRRETIRTLSLRDLVHAGGGMMDKTLGICGQSKGTLCPTSHDVAGCSGDQ